MEQLFDGPAKVFYRLNPPNLRWLRLGKLNLGQWVRPFLKLLAQLRWLRGKPFDPFGFSSCRRLEKALIEWYLSLVEEVLGGIKGENYALAVKILESAEGIRGFEHVKEKSAAKIQGDVQILLDQLAGDKAPEKTGEENRPRAEA